MNHRNAVSLAVALIVVTLAGCADVHPDPAAVRLVGQVEASAPQVADVQPQPATNVPF